MEGITVYQRASDGYFNATAMCKAAGREIKHYNSIDTARAFLTELSASVGIPTDRIVLTIKDGPNAGRGTWVHPDVAIHLAQWCSAKFAVQVSRWVREWFTTGKAPKVAIDYSDPVVMCERYLEAERPHLHVWHLWHRVNHD